MGYLEHESIGNTNAAFSLCYKAMVALPGTHAGNGLRFLYSFSIKKVLRSTVLYFLLPWQRQSGRGSHWCHICRFCSFVLSLAEMIRVVIVAMRKKHRRLDHRCWLCNILCKPDTGDCVGYCGKFFPSVVVCTFYLTGVLPVMLSMSVYLRRKLPLRIRVSTLNREERLNFNWKCPKETELKKAELKQLTMPWKKHMPASKQPRPSWSNQNGIVGELTAGITHEIKTRWTSWIIFLK